MSFGMRRDFKVYWNETSMSSFELVCDSDIGDDLVSYQDVIIVKYANKITRQPCQNINL